MNFPALEKLHEILQHLETRVLWHLLVKQNNSRIAEDVACGVIRHINGSSNRVVSQSLYSRWTNCLLPNKLFSSDCGLLPWQAYMHVWKHCIYLLNLLNAWQMTKNGNKYAFQGQETCHVESTQIKHHGHVFMCFLLSTIIIYLLPQ